MIKKTKLAKAIAIVAVGSLSLGLASNASAHVMYNTYNMDGTAGGPDGWTGSGIPWLGVAGGANPFGYIGNQAQNWAVEIRNNGQASVVSRAEAIEDYGDTATVDLDSANGAWGSWPIDPLSPSSGNQGWAHQTDFGLIKSDVATDVRVDVSSLSGGIDNYGITVFTGMDDGTALFDHHAPWNIDYIPGAFEGPAMVDNPLGTNGVIYKAHGDSSTVTFHAEADQVYSIYLGGNVVGGTPFAGVEGYVATVSAVPVPASVWLMGSALMGLVGVSRKRRA